MPFAATERARTAVSTNCTKAGASAWAKVTFRDFNHQNPSSPLMLVEAGPQNLKHARLDATERFEHQSLYDHGDDGNRYARFAMEAEEAQAHRYTGGGYAWRMTTAGAVTVANHPVLENNQGIRDPARASRGSERLRSTARSCRTATASRCCRRIPYRAPRGTPKPVIHGTQSAIVVGPKGEEIYTNGSAVKVHFRGIGAARRTAPIRCGCVYRNRGRATAGARPRFRGSSRKCWWRSTRGPG